MVGHHPPQGGGPSGRPQGRSRYTSEDDSKKIFQKTIGELAKPLNDYFKDASILVNQYDKYYCIFHENEDHKIEKYAELLWTYRGTGFQQAEGFVWNITFSYTGIMKLSCAQTFRVGFHIHIQSNELEEIKSYFENNKLTSNNLEGRIELSSNSYYNFVGPNNSFYRETPVKSLEDIDKEDLYRH